MPSLDDVVSAITMATRQSRVFEHRNVMEILIVHADNALVKSPQTHEQPLFGGHKMACSSRRQRSHLRAGHHTAGVQS
ncbi:MAG: hypothetical protein IPK19_21685 [Chloroflexi bacterium]|nr:hypothetical protein [Chloroflexota bacterium]